MDGEMCYTLTRQERRNARCVGQRRLDQAVREHRRDTLGTNSLASHDLGCAGEIVFARFRGVPWDESCGTYKSRPDVDGYEVRTRRGDRARLIVRPNDLDERPFVLVTLRDGWTFRVVGWMWARDAKQPPFWKPEYGEPHAWWVPQSALHSFT